MGKKKLQIGILDYTGVLSAYGLRSKPTEEIVTLTKRIEEKGHIPKIYAVDQCQIFFHGRKSELLERNHVLKTCDVLIPRLDLASSTDLEVSLIKQFQQMGVPVINGHLPTLAAKNKLRTLQILTQKKIPIPKTVVVRKFDYLDAAIEEVGGYPVILKSPFGSFGVGVVIVESRRSLYSALDFIANVSDSGLLMIQEYVEESDGSDYRAFVIDGKVVASMQRKSRSGDFRSNLHLGGKAYKVQLTDEEKTVAIKAARSLGLQVAGVDILRSDDGPKIMEVNSNPGFVGLSKITGIDVAGEFVDYAIRLAQSSRKPK